MAVKAQRNYYAMPAAGDALNARVEVLAETIPKGSVILDLGCNDGSISNALLERGVVSRSYGFDLEDILAHRHPGFVFQAADMKKLDLSTLPDADGALILNLLHHLVGSSKERAKEVIDYLIDRYTFVIIDMGSFTENGDWYWRRAYDRNWKSDGQMWNFLFSKAQWRFKLLRYPTQGKGQRTLWKLYKEPYDVRNLDVTGTFMRPPGSWPDGKHLIPVADVGDTKVVNSVEFSQARSSMGDKFWIKKYKVRTREIRAELEDRLAAHAAREIESLNERTESNFRAVRPVLAEPDGKLVFIFEPDLFAGSIVHFQDWPEFFTPAVCRAAGVLGTRPLEIMPELPRMMLIHACDFQICETWDGYAVLDFEPNNWLVRVCQNNGRAEAPPKQGEASTETQPSAYVSARLAGIDTALDHIKADMNELRRALLKSPG